MKRTQSVTRVEIGNESYCISSCLDADATRDVIRCVDAQVRAVEGRYGNLSRSKIAVLAAMELAGELIQLRREREGLIQQTEDQIQRLNELVEQRLVLLPLLDEGVKSKASVIKSL